MKKTTAKLMLSLLVFSSILTGCNNQATQTNLVPLVTEQQTTVSSASNISSIIKSKDGCGNFKAILTFDSKKDSGFMNSDFDSFLVPYKSDVDCAEVELKNSGQALKRYVFTIQGANQAKLNSIMADYNRHLKTVG